MRQLLISAKNAEPEAAIAPWAWACQGTPGRRLSLEAERDLRLPDEAELRPGSDVARAEAASSASTPRA